MSLKDFLEFRLIEMSDDKAITISTVFAVLAFCAMAWLLLRSIRKFLKLVEKKERIDAGQTYAIYQITKYLVITILIVVILESLHVKITILLAGSAALLVGIGMGLQHLFNDLVCGFILLMEPTIRIGDIIEVDGVVAKVKEIGIRTSQIESRFGIVMFIPNHKLVTEKVINWTTGRKMNMFHISVGVAYGSDASKVRDVLLDCAARHNEVRTQPKPFVRFEDFGESSLRFDLFFWSASMFNAEDVKSDLRFIVSSEFRKHSIQIPFPQRDLHIKSSSIDNEKNDFKI